MNATSTLRPSAISPCSRVRTVGDDLALLDLLALLDDRLLVDAGAGVRAHELPQLVDVDAVLPDRASASSCLRAFRRPW